MFFEPPLQPLPANGVGATALNANVLVLNRFYQAIRVINVRRAFSLLCRELAEVVHIETDAAGQSRWQNFDFAGWQELSRSRPSSSRMASIGFTRCGSRSRCRGSSACWATTSFPGRM